MDQSKTTELLLDSGAACRVRPCRVTAGYSCDAFLTATGAQANTFQDTLEVKSQRIDVHGEKITVTSDHECLPSCRKRGCCHHGKRMQIQIVQKKDREIRLHKFNSVCEVHESELSGLYSLKRSNVDGSSAECERDDQAVDTKTPIQTHRGRKNVSLSQSCSIQSWVCSLLFARKPIRTISGVFGIN